MSQRLLQGDQLGIQYNIDVDTHPYTPIGVGLGVNDEFEYSTSLDTSGLRYPGASSWNIANGATNLVSNVANGALSCYCTSGQASILQPVPSGAWTVVSKISGFGFLNNYSAGITVNNLSSNNGIVWDIANVGGVSNLLAQRQTNYAYVSNPYLSSSPMSYLGFSGSLDFGYQYLSISYDGVSSLSFYYSLTGQPGTFRSIYTESTGSFIGGVTHFGLHIAISSPAAMYYDYFRRVA